MALRAFARSYNERSFDQKSSPGPAGSKPPRCRNCTPSSKGGDEIKAFGGKHPNSATADCPAHGKSGLAEDGAVAPRVCAGCLDATGRSVLMPAPLSCARAIAEFRARITRQHATAIIRRPLKIRVWYISRLAPTEL